IPKQEEYVGAAPPVALLPWFFAGSFFPISALPAGLTAFAKVLPLTHALALMRYGLVDPNGSGLHNIWGMTNTTAMAWMSLGVGSWHGLSRGAVGGMAARPRRIATGGVDRAVVVRTSATSEGWSSTEGVDQRGRRGNAGTDRRWHRSQQHRRQRGAGRRRRYE